MEPGIEHILQVLDEYPDQDVVIPILGSALEEPSAAAHAISLLEATAESRAPREFVRRWNHLSAAQQTGLLERGFSRLLAAAGQLVRSDHLATRQNIAALIAGVIDHRLATPTDVLPVLLFLIDDPQESVRSAARDSFLRAVLGAADATALVHGPQDPLLKGLQILLNQLPHHEDDNVVRALFAVGMLGADLLARAIGEQWESAGDIKRIAAESVADPGAVALRVDALFHWLNSTFPETREAARQLLRDHTDAPFLRCCAERLSSDPESAESGKEPPVCRNLRWDLLPIEDLDGLPQETIRRIAHFLTDSPGTQQERAERIARLLPVTQSDVHRELLVLLRDYPTETLTEQLQRELLDVDPEIQGLATELISLNAGRPAFRLLIEQLRSDHAEVRNIAQRKISGQSLSFYLQAHDSLASEERRASLQVLARVDLHFHGQLRRALRSTDESIVVRALGTLLELDDVTPVEDSLYDLTVSPSPKVRATLARALGRSPGDREGHYLRLFLNDDDPRVVANAVETLGRAHDDRFVPLLKNLRNHDNHRVRCNALLALHHHGDPDAAAELHTLTQPTTSSNAMRTAAAWAISQLAKD